MPVPNLIPLIFQRPMNEISKKEQPDAAAFNQSLTQQKIMTLQATVIALISSVLTLAGVAFFMVGSKELSLLEDDGSEFAIITLVVTLGATIISFVMPKFMSKIETHPPQASDSSPTDRAFARIQSQYIVRFGILEGAAVLGCVFFMIDTSIIHLFAIVPLFAGAALGFPTRQRVIDTYAKSIGETTASTTYSTPH